MNLLLKLVVVLLAVEIVASLQVKETEEKTIRGREHEMLTAYYKGDADALAQIELEDFTVADETGEETRADQLAGIRRRKVPDMNATYSVEHENFRLLGSIALVTETLAVTVQGDSKPEIERLYATEVWVKQSGEWKIEHLHFCELKEHS